MHHANKAADRFFAFAQGWKISKPEPDAWLDFLLIRWLQYGDGVEAIDADYTVFIETALVVLHRLHDDPSLLDYKYTISRGRKRVIQRRMDRVFGFARPQQYMVEFRRGFDTAVAEHRRLRRS